ncbi:MAG: site-2 protease family protein [Bdellovibrionota bacterium]
MIRSILLFIPMLILCLSVHEWAHAKTADLLGDATPRFMGRLTLDPMAHITLVGTIVLPCLALITGLPLFGWAKPVPIDARNFKNPRSGMAIVAAAGPTSNIIMATLMMAILAYLNHHHQMGIGEIKAQGGLAGAGVEMLTLGVQLNAFLAFFNLIPLPPLDGSRVLQGFLGHQGAATIDRMESWSTWVLIILAVSGVLRYLAIPVFIFLGALQNLFHVY